MADLRQEFERIRARLLQDGRKRNASGAFARAMLNIIPAFIHHLERERKASIDAHDVLEGVANCLANVVAHSVSSCVSEADQAKALEVVIRRIYEGAATRTKTSAGGIVLPFNGMGVLS